MSAHFKAAALQRPMGRPKGFICEARTGRKSMTLETTRRRFLVGTGLTAAAATIGLPAFEQDKPTLRFSAVFSEQDIRAEMLKMFADAIKGAFAFEGYRSEEHTSELQSLLRNSDAD